MASASSRPLAKKNREMPVVPPASTLTLLRLTAPALATPPMKPTATLAIPC